MRAGLVSMFVAAGCAAEVGSADPPRTVPAEVNAPCGAGDSFVEGEISANWALTSDLGETTTLHQFCGKVVFFEDGAGW